jgi:hypothetical protein
MGLFDFSKDRKEPGWFERDQPEIPEWRKQLGWITPTEKFKSWREKATDGFASGFLGATGAKLLKKALWIVREEKAKNELLAEKSKEKGRGF